MRAGHLRSPMFWAFAFVLWFVVTGPVQSGEAKGDVAAEILERAFANRFEVDTTAEVELVVRNGAGQELRRRLQGVSKVVEGRLCSIGKLVWPARLRGMTVLVIEAFDRSHDAFVYLPSMKRVRRISTAQRADSFFGTDVTYEDLERRRSSDYVILANESGVSGGEAVHRVAARAVDARSYDRIVFVIADADAAILEMHYFERDEAEPFRSILAPREAMLRADGHVLPTRLQIENHRRGRTTEVTYRDLRVNPPLDPHLFSVGTLEFERPLPGFR